MRGRGPSVGGHRTGQGDPWGSVAGGAGAGVGRAEGNGPRDGEMRDADSRVVGRRVEGDPERPVHIHVAAWRTAAIAADAAAAAGAEPPVLQNRCRHVCV